MNFSMKHIITRDLLIVAVLVWLITLAWLLIANRGQPPAFEIALPYQQGEVRAELKRGGLIETGPSSRAFLIIGQTKIGLYENTVLRLDRLFIEEPLEFFLSKGRLAIATPDDHAVIVKTDRVKAVGSAMSVVNYDFQERVSVIPLKGQVDILINKEQTVTLLTMDGLLLEVSEIEPFTINRSSFDLSASSSAEFYEWFAALFDNE